MYKNYIFDLYGTLVDIRTDESSKSLWDNMSMFYSLNGAPYTADQLNRKYCEYVYDEKKAIEKAYPAYEYIDIAIDSVFNRLYFDRGVRASKELIEVTARLFRCLSTIKPVVLYDGVVEFFEELHKRRKRIFLLSNAQRSFAVPELKRVGIYDKFDGIFISSDEFCCKPDVLFYQKLFYKYGLKKEESIMIGNDEDSDIKGANSFGIDSLYIHSEISSKLKNGHPECKYFIDDGDFRKIRNLIL